MSYDSTQDTRKHIARVRDLLEDFMAELEGRATHHDETKLDSPEKEVFDEFTPKLKGSTYGSDEYKGFLAAMKPALDHHYAHNRHHPEHNTPVECIICLTDVSEFVNGMCPNCGNSQTGSPLPTLRGMTLIDLIEMLCDWKAAGERHANGSIEASLQVNRARFNIPDQLLHVLENTAKAMGWTQTGKPK